MQNRRLTEIKGIGPRRAQLLGAQGLFSFRDILYFFPRSYHDYSAIKPISELNCGDDAAILVRALDAPRVRYIRRGMNIVNVRAEDGHGDKIELIWFNQAYRAAQIPRGGYFYACGRVSDKRGLKLISPSLSERLPGIIPVYPIVKGVSQKVIADTVRMVLHVCSDGDEIEETLTERIREEYSLISMGNAITLMHGPKDMSSLIQARRRLAFEDMLIFRVMLSISGDTERYKTGMAFDIRGLKNEFMLKLPFELTAAQERVIDDINKDMSKERVMNRLVQGDVGSGKTALAFYAMFVAVKNGAQAVLMAPTEILAQQHYIKLKELFGDEAALITGSMKKKARDEAYEAIRTGRVKAIVGTHALLFGSAEFKNVGIVIVDEQHRFGVRQRAAIQSKSGLPHMLVMSATPIPRTLALIIYGDLDISVLDELPPGRRPVITRIVPASRREDMYGFIDDMSKKGFQSFVVCPLIENSDALDNVMSATELYKQLKVKLKASVELLTGETETAEKQRITDAFTRGEISVLVSTTVIEVGVDVPNAAVMAIESADRFGLAQLHQLRGRVGRGMAQSYCFLLSDNRSESANERLSVLANTNDGFKIAEYDLENRGPGEFLGARQHGMDEFTAARLAMDMGVISDASELADRLIEQGETSVDAADVFKKARFMLKSKSNIIMN